jgi:hypothetical protein
MSNVMICEEDLERGKGRGRWQRKTTFVLLWFLGLLSICTATPQKQPFLYMCWLGFVLWCTLLCHSRSGKWIPTCRRNTTILTVEVYSKVEVVWFPFSWYGGVKGLNSCSIFWFLSYHFLSSIVYGCLAFVLPNTDCNCSVSESHVTHFLLFLIFSARHKFQNLP